jgi:hypothetical protein
VRVRVRVRVHVRMHVHVHVRVRMHVHVHVHVHLRHVLSPAARACQRRSTQSVPAAAAVWHAARAAAVGTHAPG